MATATTTQTTADPSYLQQYLSTLQSGQVDPTKINQRVESAIANSQVPSQSATVKSAKDITSKWKEGSVEKAAGNAAISNFQSQVDASQKQAANQSAALQTKSEATQSYVASLNALGEAAVSGMAESVAAWNKYTTTADQYLKDSASRMASVTADIKSTIEQYAKTNDSALANSIQANSYAWLQTNKATERSIAERYGTNSAEYMQWQESKRASIGAMVSDLTAQAWDKTQAILNTGIGALATAETSLATDVNLAQKNSLDALQAAATAGDQYRLNASSYLMTIEAAKNTAWSDLADWIDASAVSAVDATALLEQLMGYQDRIDAQNNAVVSASLSSVPASWSQGMKARG